MARDRRDVEGVRLSERSVGGRADWGGNWGRLAMVGRGNTAVSMLRNSHVS